MATTSETETGGDTEIAPPPPRLRVAADEDESQSQGEPQEPEGEVTYVAPPDEDVTPPARPVAVRPKPAPAIAAKRTVATVAPPRQPANRSEALAALKREEQGELKDWLLGLGQAAQFKVYVERTEPEVFRGVKTNGHVQTYATPIDEEGIQKAHGGGTYKLRVMILNEKGRYEIFTNKTIHVAGDPKVESLKMSGDDPKPVVAAPAAPVSDPMATKAFDLMADRLKELEARAVAAATPPAFDTVMLDRLTQPLRETITELKMQLSALTQPKPQTVEEKAEEKLVFKLIDGDTTRMRDLESRLQGELRVVKENAREDEKRVKDAHERELAAAKEDFKSRLEDLKTLHAVVLEQVKGSLNVTLENQKAHIARLEREIGQQEVELKELRAKKDKSIFEQMKEVKAVKELFEDGDDEKEEGSGVERVISRLIESPLTEKVAEGVMSRFAPQPQQEAQVPPIGVPFQGGDGNLYMNTGQAIVRVKRKKKKGAAGEGEGAPGAEGGGEGGEGGEGQAPAALPEPQIDKATAALAVEYLAGAYKSGTDPEIVAQSVRTMVPSDVLAYIGAHGVDPFLDKVAGLSKSSPLSQQGGRNWARKVGKALVGE